MNTLSCPSDIFQRLLLAFAEDRSLVIFLRVGINNAAPAREWLARDLILEPPVLQVSRQYFRVSLSDAPPSAASARLWREPLSPSVIGDLGLGDGLRRGQLWGAVCVGETIEPLDRLFLVGSGMHAIPMNSGDQPRRPFRLRELFTPTRWSRTIGALGGLDVWQRFAHLSFAIIGCGRTGSLIASTLLRMGARRLALIDPDAIEAHNLGEMDIVSESDLGRPKATAIAEALQSQFPRLAAQLTPIVKPITDPEARTAALRSDVFFCCVDNDAARLTTALLATLYHKVLVDLGTGIFFRRQADAGRTVSSAASAGRAPTLRTMGADVRLILPGHGCLLCVGHLTDYRQAVEDICNHRPPSVLGSDWSGERAGSLRSLNQMAAGLGVQMLQDLVAERIADSIWAQFECDEAGRVQVLYPPAPQPAARSSCRLCAKAGMGDEAFSWSGR